MKTFFLFLFSMTAIFAGAQDIVLTPTDDALVQRLQTTPFTGSTPNLLIRRGTEEPVYNRYALFKFDISSLPAAITGDVLFRLYFKEERSGSSLVYNDIVRQLVAAELPGWTWTEATLTPYSVPNPATADNPQFIAFAQSLENARIDISSTVRSTITTGVYWEWDLTGFVKEKQQEGKNVFTIMIYESNNTGGQGSSDMYFLSKESPVNKPQLVATTVSTNARLASISVDKEGTGSFAPLSGFDEYKTNYIYQLPATATEVPVINAIAKKDGATVQIQQAQNIEGEIEERSATITVTALDGVTQEIYTVTFEKQEGGGGDATTVELKLWKSATARYTRNAQIVSLIPLFQKDENAIDIENWYGSNYRIRTDSTGFYYVKKIDGRWWLIDPDGYAGINKAVTTINTPADKADWAYDLLKDLGYNGAGNFITPENLPITQYNNKSFEPFSYTRRGLGDSGAGGGFFQRFNNPYPAGKTKESYITILGPEFETFCDTHARNFFAASDNERNLMGVFSDNEIGFNQDQLQNFLRDLPATDPNYIAALNFITGKGITLNDVLNNYALVSNDVKEEFAGLLAERYYSVVSAALKKYLPHHLYLGSRLNGRPRAIKAVVEAASKFCDVISVNFYDFPTPNEEITNPKKWGEWTHDKPCLITEFYVKGLEPSNIDLQDGTGYMVQTQNDRGVFYQNTCLEALQSNYFIGWQYFRWIDDGTSNKGIVSVNYEPWKEMGSYMQELNTQVYNLIDFMDDRTYTPVNTSEVVLHPVGDSYINLSGSTTNKGSETTLLIAGNQASGSVCETFLKFALGVYKDSLHYLDDAKIRLYNASGTYADYELKTFGVEDNNWDEATLTAETAAPDMRSAFGKLKDKTISITADKDYADLNVRNWLLRGVDKPDYVTFRITDNSSNTESSAWYSKENPVKQPELILNFRIQTPTGTNNPKTGDVHLYQNEGRLCVSGIHEPVQYGIYTTSGVCVQKDMLTSDAALTVSLPAGVYIFKLGNKNQINTFKIIVK